MEFIHLSVRVLTHAYYNNITTLYSINLFLHVEVCDMKAVYLFIISVFICCLGVQECK